MQLVSLLEEDQFFGQGWYRIFCAALNHDLIWRFD